MTDKQIIIDGVDVSWCKHYKHNDKNSGWSSCTSKDEDHIHAVNPLCCEKKDCLYKQLKAKEQECERLKTQYNCYACGTCNGKEDYRNLEKHYIGLRKSFDELHKQLDQLKACLTEIKEIAESSMREGKMISGGWLSQKISEVENE